MATAILWVFDHPSEARILGRHARVIALQQFHPKKLIEQEKACFERVLLSIHQIPAVISRFPKKQRFGSRNECSNALDKL